MDSLGTRLRTAREKAGLSQAELARRVGIKQPSIQAIESGKVAGTKHLNTIARVLSVDPNWLEVPQKAAETFEEKSSHVKGLTAEALVNGGELSGFRPLPVLDRRDVIPVLGSTEGGDDGSFPWNGEVIDQVARPPFLANVSNGYALFVSGMSMAPRYEPGDTIFVHPSKPVTVGCYVVVQVLDPGNKSTPRAFLKRLVRRTPDTLILEQFQPPKQIKIPLKDVVSIHRVVGSGD